MTSGHCLREQLAALFLAQKQKADAVLEVLEREREALLAGDLAALETVAQEKTTLLDELEEMRSEESRLLHLKGADYFFGSRREQDSPAGNKVKSVRSAHRNAVDAIAECQSLNARNGLLLQHRIGYVKRALQALGGGDGNPGLYGSDGKIETSSRHRCVARG